MQVREIIPLRGKKENAKPKAVLIIAFILVLSGLMTFGLLAAKFESKSTESPFWDRPPIVEKRVTHEVARSGGGRKLLQLPPVNVTLGAASTRYLHLVLLCEVVGDLKPRRVDTHFPQFTQELRRLMERKTLEDVRSPAGKQQLLDEVKTRLNTVLGEPVIRQVYYDTFLHN